MQLSAEEIVDAFSLPDHLQVYRAKFVPATKSKKPFVEISFSINGATVKRKQKDILVSDDIESDFRNAVQHLIDSVAPRKRPSPSPIKKSKKSTSPVKKRHAILRPSTLCFTSPVLCPTENKSCGGSRAGAGRPSKGLAKKTPKQRRRLQTLKKLKDARKNKRKQETYAAKRVQQLQKIRTKRITFVGKLQRALESGNFTNVFNGPIQNVSSFQLAKVSIQAPCLLLYYKTSVEGPPKLKTFLYSEVSKQMPFSISAKTVSRWVTDF